MHRTRVTRHQPPPPLQPSSDLYPFGRHVLQRQYGNKRLIVRVTHMRGGFPFYASIVAGTIPEFIDGKCRLGRAFAATAYKQKSVAIRFKSDLEDTIELAQISCRHQKYVFQMHSFNSTNFQMATYE